MLIGLRGVGKTVLLDRMMKDAEAEGVITYSMNLRKESFQAKTG
jgi:predicted AAA+ superfamily ATPase